MVVTALTRDPAKRTGHSRPLPWAAYSPTELTMYFGWEWVLPSQTAADPGTRVIRREAA